MISYGLYFFPTSILLPRSFEFYKMQLQKSLSKVSLMKLYKIEEREIQVQIEFNN